MFGKYGPRGPVYQADGGEGGGNGGGSDSGDMVPRSRLNEEIGKKKEALAQLTRVNDDNSKLAAAASGYKQRLQETQQERDQLKGQMDGFDDFDVVKTQAKDAKRYKQERDEYKTKLEQQQVRYKRDKAMLGAGIDDEDAQDLLVNKYRKQKDKDDGAKSFKDFLAGQVKAAEKGEAKYLSPFISESDDDDDDDDDESDDKDKKKGKGGDDDKDKGKGKKKKRKTPGNEGVTRTPNVGDSLDPVNIARMSRKEFKESGLLDKYRR